MLPVLRIKEDIILFFFYFFLIIYYLYYYIDFYFYKFSFINFLCFDQSSLVLIKTFFRNLKIQNF